MFHETFVYRLAARFVHFIFDIAYSGADVLEEQVSVTKVDTRKVSQRTVTGNIHSGGVSIFSNEGKLQTICRNGTLSNQEPQR
jgi:hypothetical protein